MKNILKRKNHDKLLERIKSLENFIGVVYVNDDYFPYHVPDNYDSKTILEQIKKK